MYAVRVDAILVNAVITNLGRNSQHRIVERACELVRHEVFSGAKDPHIAAARNQNRDTAKFGNNASPDVRGLKKRVDD